MASSSKMRFEMLRKQGMTDRDAMFAMIDHFNEQHWYDRDRYHARIKELETELAKLRGGNA